MFADLLYAVEAVQSRFSVRITSAHLVRVFASEEALLGYKAAAYKLQTLEVRSSRGERRACYDHCPCQTASYRDTASAAPPRGSPHFALLASALPGVVDLNETLVRFKGLAQQWRTSTCRPSRSSPRPKVRLACSLSAVSSAATQSQADRNTLAGVYTLVSTLSPAASSTQGSSTAHFTPSAAAATPAPGGQNVVAALEQANAPPAYPSRLAVVAVQLPKAGAGLSGLGMSIGRGRGKDAEAGPTTPGLSAGDTANPLDSLAGSGNGGAAGTTSGQAPSSPVPKRKPLTSSFSMLGGLSLASGEGGAVATSRPARAFKGSSSSFIRSWEGLPLSQVQLKAIAESNAGRDTIFGIQTLGKAIVWSEIGQGKKVRRQPSIALSRPQGRADVDLTRRTRWLVSSSRPSQPASMRTSTLRQDRKLTSSSASIRATSSGWVRASPVSRSASPTDVLARADPLTARYSRFNKSGCITSSAITSILWLPPAPPTSASSPGTDPNYSPPGNRSNLFVTSHADGSIVLWDKDKEDWNGFVTQPFPSVASAYTPGLDSASSPGKENEWPLAGAGAANRGSFKVAAGQEDMVVSKPPATDRKGQTATKNNPVAHWRLSRKAITGAARFMPLLGSRTSCSLRPRSFRILARSDAVRRCRRRRVPAHHRRARRAVRHCVAFRQAVLVC